VTRFRAALGVAVTMLGLGASAAGAQTYGQLASAETVPINGHVFGAYINASDTLFGLLAQLRLSFYPNVDFGFQGGLARLDVGSSNRTLLRLGSDVKFVTARAGPAFPMDLAFDASLGVENADNYNVLRFGPALVGSRSFPLGGRSAIVPYAGLGLTFTRYDILGTNDTDFAVPFRAGAELRLAPELRVLAEFQVNFSDQLNDDVGFATGVNLPF